MIVIDYGFCICYVSLTHVIGTSLGVKLMYEKLLWKGEQFVSKEVAIYYYLDDKNVENNLRCLCEEQVAKD